MSLLSEPSMRWYGMKDDRNNLVALKIPISSCDSSRKPLKSVGHENTKAAIKNMSFKDIGEFTSGSEGEMESIALLSRSIPQRYDEKKQMNNANSGKSNKCRTLKEDIFKTSLICKTKLKDRDISQLLDDDDNTNDAIFMHNKVTGKRISDQNLQLKSSRQKAYEAPENTVLCVRKSSKADTTDVELEQVQRSSIHKCDRKLKINSTKDVSYKLDCRSKNVDLLSTLTSPSETVVLKQHPDQWSEEIEGCTKWKTVCERSPYISLEALPLRDAVNTRVSASISTPGSASLLAVRHIDDEVAKRSNSESSTSKLKDVYRTSAKKKLSYEDSGTNQKFYIGESPDKCNITDANHMLKYDRTMGPGKVTDRRTELTTPKLGCTDNSTNCLEPVHKSKVIDYYLESSKNSKALNRCEGHLQKV
jgi:hypothetical protein